MPNQEDPEVTEPEAEASGAFVPDHDADHDADHDEAIVGEAAITAAPAADGAALTETLPTETLPTETLPTETLPTETLPTETLAADVVAAGTVRSVAEEEHDQDRAATTYGWIYLAVLTALFLALALIAFSCDDDETSTLAPGDSAVTTVSVDAGDGTPVAVEALVDGATVVLTGSVPDEGARTQIVSLAEEQYGDGNVTDQLSVDPSVMLTGGSFSVGGSTAEGDDRPTSLQDAVAGALGLDGGGFDVIFEAVTVEPVDAEASIAAGAVVLSGALPDQQSIDSLIAASEGVWGVGNVDGSGLTIGATTWAGGTIRVSGAIDAGDARGDAFAEALAALDPGLSIDTSALTVDTGAEALARAEELLRAALEANPILFAVNSSEIDPASDEILAQAAAAINAAPGIGVEIVGHTDDSGSAELNQALSADRAQAVLDRLVELGVEAPRLTSRGAGEDEPIADNTTEEGKAANRRIAFEFQGAA